MDTSSEVGGGDAQMRRADGIWIRHAQTRRRVRRLRRLERSRRGLLKVEAERSAGPRMRVLQALERAADWAHDLRLFELEKMKTLARTARGVEMLARCLYEAADGGQQEQ